VTPIINTIPSDFQYAGYYEHQTSGLNFTKYRAYDPNTAKWLSRDPLRHAEISQGPNLYGYVHNQTISRSDLLGLCDDCMKKLEQEDQSIEEHADEVIARDTEAIDSGKKALDKVEQALGAANEKALAAGRAAAELEATNPLGEAAVLLFQLISEAISEANEATFFATEVGNLEGELALDLAAIAAARSTEARQKDKAADDYYKCKAENP
jgi:RHS repeat-associated protein